jgi:ABC-2 type transport system permease protein
VIRAVRKLWAFVVRDLQSAVSYRLSFILQIGGMTFSVLAMYFVTKMIDPKTEGLDGIPPFQWMLIGLSFQFYFSTALYSFSEKIRSEQMLGTLEAMLVSPTPTSIVIFSSAAWDFVWGGFRVAIYLTIAVLLFGVQLYTNSLVLLGLGVVLTLLSSAGLGILSASFILYFKRGNPINFLLSAMTTFFGTVFFPKEQLPQWVQWVSDYLPITWSLRIVRGALLQGRGFDELGPDLVQLAVLTVILLPAGLLASRFAIRHAKREGTLVQY